MRASEIQTLIRGHHDELRRLMDELDALVTRIHDEEEEASAAVHERSRELHRRLCDHAVVEGAVLIPCLHRRHQDLVERHREQREWLGAALVEAAREARRRHEFVTSVRPLLALLREQTEQEARALLGDEILRDEPERDDRPAEAEERAEHGRSTAAQAVER